MPGDERKWRALNQVGQGVFNTLSKEVAEIEGKLPHKIPDIRSASRVVMASDYSGDHRGARYQVLSFLLGDESRFETWRSMVRAIRGQLLRPTTEMCFKKRKEGARSRALPHWLLAANVLPGLCLTVLIDRALDGVTLGPSQASTIAQTRRMEWKRWAPSEFERLIRILFYGLTVIRGLAREPQSVLWAMDDDAIVPRPDIWPFFRLALEASAQQHFRFFSSVDFTVASEDGPTEFTRRDLCSIPDIVAGTLGTALKDVPIPESNISPDDISWFGDDVSLEVKTLVNWLADDRWPLKRLLFVVHRGEQGLYSPRFLWTLIWGTS